MTQADERILEVLDSTDLILTAAVLSYNLSYERQYLSERLGILADQKLVERVSHGQYRITDRGRAYLSGELDTNDLEE